MRKRLAQARPRVKGQFVKREVAAAYYKALQEEQGAAPAHLAADGAAAAAAPVVVLPLDAAGAAAVQGVGG